jgi:hypothetical protein
MHADRQAPTYIHPAASVSEPTGPFFPRPLQLWIPKHLSCHKLSVELPRRFPALRAWGWKSGKAVNHITTCSDMVNDFLGLGKMLQIFFSCGYGTIT